jgi:sugar lactone lactonase YvrE
MSIVKVFAAERISVLPVKLGEGPCWDRIRHNLVWVDITGGTLNRYDPESGKTTRFNMGQMIGCASPMPDGKTLVALTSGVYIFDERIPGEEHIAACLCRPISMSLQERFNDGKLDPAGHFVVGTMVFSGRWRIGGHLYSISIDGTVLELLNGVGISNGLDWSVDGKTMYYIDSLIPSVFAFDYDLGTGQIYNRRIAFDLPLDAGVVPDGLCIDRRGMLWVAHGGGGSIGCYNPANGTLIARVNISQPNVTSCCFGDRDDELYITTADDTNANFVDTAANGGIYVVHITL